jgi:hypothetical protein
LSTPAWHSRIRPGRSAGVPFCLVSSGTFVRRCSPGLKKIRHAPGLLEQERMTRFEPTRLNSGDTMMKTLIAAAILAATAGTAQAQSFAYEQQVGSAELYSTLATQEARPGILVGDFAYQSAVGSDDLFSLGHDDVSAPNGGRTAFEYQLNIGSAELDPSLS